MGVVELRDRLEIAGLLRRNRFLHVYELGDLDDFFWPHTRFVGWDGGSGPTEAALLYTEPETPVLIALADANNGDGDMTQLLEALLPELPSPLYAHLSPGLLKLFRRRYRTDSHGLHLKMGLARTDLLGSGEAEQLGPANLPEVTAFYEDAYPGTWFVPRMLETERYVGVRERGALACVAGVHVWSPAWGVAALGNVATLPSHRGRGLATRACGALCRLLLEVDAIDTISLNVRADNVAALASYRRLGFEPAGEYVEVELLI